jgi:hypothetical protein
MIGLFRFVLAALASPFKSKLRLEAENAVLRHQLIVLRRKLQGRVRLTNHYRWFLIQLYRSSAGSTRAAPLARGFVYLAVVLDWVAFCLRHFLADFAKGDAAGAVDHVVQRCLGGQKTDPRPRRDHGRDRKTAAAESAAGKIESFFGSA